MHTAQDLFIAHVFNCEPSSGALCKTIEAACKVKILFLKGLNPLSETEILDEKGVSVSSLS